MSSVEQRLAQEREALRARIDTVGTPERSAYFDGHSEGYESGYREGRVASIRMILNSLRHDRQARMEVLADVVASLGDANGIKAAHGSLVEQIERHGR